MERVIEYSRQRKSQHFYSLFIQREFVLDAEISRARRREPATRNFFLNNIFMILEFTQDWVLKT